MTKIQKFAASASAVAAVFAAAPMVAFAQLNDVVNINPPGIGQNLSNIRPSGIISTVINLALGIAGVLAFLYLLWGGIQWILAGGDKEGAEKARKKITAALVGLAIVFSAYALIFIIQALFNINIIQVNLASINGSY